MKLRQEKNDDAMREQNVRDLIEALKALSERLLKLEKLNSLNTEQTVNSDKWFLYQHDKRIAELEKEITAPICYIKSSIKEAMDEKKFTLTDMVDYAYLIKHGLPVNRLTNEKETDLLFRVNRATEEDIELKNKQKEDGKSDNQKLADALKKMQESSYIMTLDLNPIKDFLDKMQPTEMKGYVPFDFEAHRSDCSKIIINNLIDIFPNKKELLKEIFKDELK